jgi:hypothetical protein
MVPPVIDPDVAVTDEIKLPPAVYQVTVSLMPVLNVLTYSALTVNA